MIWNGWKSNSNAVDTFYSRLSKVARVVTCQLLDDSKMALHSATPLQVKFSTSIIEMHIWEQNVKAKLLAVVPADSISDFCCD